MEADESTTTPTTTLRDQPYQLEHLPDRDLLATLLGNTARSGQLASELIAIYGNIPTLGRAHPADLADRLPAGKAATLAAAIELGRRAQRTREDRPQIRTSGDVFAFYGPRLSHLSHEVFHIMCLDSKHRLLRDERVVEGGLTTCSVLPREVFAPALRAGATAVIFVHNHPSGDPGPSSDDLELTARLKQAGAVLCIKPLDHIIVGEGRYVSLADEGQFSAL